MPKNTNFDEEIAFYNKGKILSEQHCGKEAMRHADVINARISALLTHVSVMIAVCVVTFAETYQHEKLGVCDTIIMGLIVCYIVVSMLCLRGIAMINCRTLRHKSDVMRYYVLEVRKRRSCYNYALLLTALFTSVFLGTLLVKMAIPFFIKFNS